MARLLLAEAKTVGLETPPRSAICSVVVATKPLGGEPLARRGQGSSTILYRIAWRPRCIRRGREQPTNAARSPGPAYLARQFERASATCSSAISRSPVTTVTALRQESLLVR
jgi:hypothetical protein